ncbi:hypothetical protein LTS17_008582 [Exophiala oligosperma]
MTSTARPFGVDPKASFTSPTAWKEIFGPRKSGRRSFDKDLRFHRVPTTKACSIVRADGEDHSRHRRTLPHAFSERALWGQEDILTHYIDLFIQNLRDKAAADGKVDMVNMVKWYNFTTFDIIGD